MATCVACISWLSRVVMLSCRCHICKTTAPSIKSMQDHHEARHPGMPWEPEKCTDVHEAFGGTTQGVAVRGSTKK